MSALRRIFHRLLPWLALLACFVVLGFMYVLAMAKGMME